MDVIAGYEKIHSVIGTIFVTIIGIVLVGVSIHLLLAPTRKSSVEGTVVSYDPSTGWVRVSYTIGSNTYFLTSQGSMSKGSTVTVLYEQGNPSNARLSTQMSNKTIALILISVTIVIMAITYISTYFVFKSKRYAAVAGGLDIASQVLSH